MELADFNPHNSFENKAIMGFANVILIDPTFYYYGPRRADYKIIDFSQNTKNIKLYYADYIAINICAGEYVIQSQYFMSGEKSGDITDWGKVKLRKNMSNYFLAKSSGLTQISEIEALWWLDKLNSKMSDIYLTSKDITGYVDSKVQCN
ncbi:hypothetical protein Q4575_19600 [Psychrosphaera sp. 1_MG-2023]|uniref:hypothetical protein n=1 Tax=Psychrosphaera sp. 1_MG-2023 TaxID=3062643 RepID=UPI0026E494FE|nr:hypothetical protein [Psychrosphaera sp. 1_MG-2023]MDO6721609.1 hypothetical protein [Psychrosphaera sp. 1_MG-2023]